GPLEPGAAPRSFGRPVALEFARSRPPENGVPRPGTGWRSATLLVVGEGTALAQTTPAIAPAGSTRSLSGLSLALRRPWRVVQASRCPRRSERCWPRHSSAHWRQPENQAGLAFRAMVRRQLSAHAQMLTPRTVP